MSAALRVLSAVVAALVVAGTWLMPARAEADPAPIAQSVSSKVVTADGGTTLTVTGKRLSRVAAVLFGTTKATRITHLSKTRLSVVVPPHRPGTVALRLVVGSQSFPTSLRVRYAAHPTTRTAAENAVLRLTNKARAAGHTCTNGRTTTVMPPVPPLRWNERLAAAARAHSADMAAKNYFSHTSADGTIFSTRITRSGYSWSAVGENIAAGYPTPSAAVKGWLASYGHCRNLMSRDFVHLGVGFAPGGHYGSYWTQDFGRPQR